MAHLVLFTDKDFGGAHKHIFDRADQLSFTTDISGNAVVVDGEFPDGVSSIAIFSGNWQFFREENLASPLPAILGPGLYSFVGNVKLPNDQIRSMTTVLADPNMFGDSLDNHVILLEHEDFRGAHQHIFEPVEDLSTYGFSHITSSIVVESGNWSFFGDTQFDGSYPQDPVIGPGIYPWVPDIGVLNDNVRSLQPSDLPATISNAVDNEVILSQYGAFFGPHRHVFAAEPNLNADDDSFFNDRVASLAILAGDWSFYSDWNFLALYNGTPAGPGTYPDVTALAIVPDDMSSLRPAVPQQVTSGQGVTGHVILFASENFDGPHRHVFNSDDDLGQGHVSFDDSVSSLAVVSGNWKFFRNPGFDDDYPPVLGPGLYAWVKDVGIRDNDMSSLTAVDDAATVTGQALDAHIMLYINARFHGDHKHIFLPDSNLSTHLDNDFYNQTSSIAVLAGVWKTCGELDFELPYKPLLGPGLYPWVPDVGIPNDAVVSLLPEQADPTTNGEVLLAHVVLFEDENLRGQHRHVFVPEPDLGASDDSFFNDKVSAAAVLLNNWFTYRDPDFTRPFDVTLGPGLFPWVLDVGIANDAMSSLQVAETRLGLVGQATVNVASGQLPRPVVDPLGMSFLFDPGTRALQIETPFADLPLESVLTIHFDSADAGSFPPDGQVTIPNMTVTLSSGLGRADTTFTLTTGTATSPTGRYVVTGSPADAAGNITLVAAGQVRGDDFSIVISGAFTPRPA
jgi:Beta/Gamma crystallin